MSTESKNNNNQAKPLTIIKNPKTDKKSFYIGNRYQGCKVWRLYWWSKALRV